MVEWECPTNPREASGLDPEAVHPEEPIAADNPLLEMDNVVTTPHIASASQDVIDRHSTVTVDDIQALAEGDRPMHVANPETLTSFSL